MIDIQTFKPVTKEKLYEITLLSANAKSKELYIFEKYFLKIKYL